MFRNRNETNRLSNPRFCRLGAILLLINLLLLSICPGSVAREPEITPSTQVSESPSPLSPTSTDTPTPMPSPSPAPTDTRTPTPSPSPTLADTPTPTEAPSPIPANAATPTASPTPPLSEPSGALGPFIAALFVIVVGVAVLIIMLFKRKRRKSPPPPPDLPSFPPAHPYLQSTAEPQLWFPLEQEIIFIGRAEINDLIIDEHYAGWKTVSQLHAQIEWDKQRQCWLVIDRNSHNGVFVRGQRTGENILRDGDTVRFGLVEFEFHIPEQGG